MLLAGFSSELATTDNVYDEAPTNHYVEVVGHRYEQAPPSIPQQSNGGEDPCTDGVLRVRPTDSICTPDTRMPPPTPTDSASQSGVPMLCAYDDNSDSDEPPAPTQMSPPAKRKRKKSHCMNCVAGTPAHC